MHYNILDKERLDILPLLEPFKSSFYLAGGTALALHLGHRDSIDFDFFTPGDFDTQELLKKLIKILSGHTVVKTQDENNTLSIIVDDSIKMSFFTYQYNLLEDLFDEPYIKVASIADIACMKLSAVTGRATSKDYIDLYFILNSYKLSELLELSAQKHNNLDTNLIIKSLVFFNDIEHEPIIFKEANSVEWQDVEKRLVRAVKELE